MSARDPYPSEKQERFIVRLPDGMRDRIKAAAEANNRSMNAEIVATLEEKYPEPHIRVSDLSIFFQMLANGVEGYTEEEEAALLKRVNADLAKQEHPYTIERGDLGTLTIYPYATPSDE